MGTPIGGKGHTSPLVGTEKVPLSPDGYATTQEVADLATGGGGLTTVIANDEDVTIPGTGGIFVVLYTAITATRSVTLPAASSPATQIIVRDVSGQASAAAQVFFDTVGADTLQGSVGHLDNPNGQLEVTNDGVSAWDDLEAPPTMPITVTDGTRTLEILPFGAGGFFELRAFLNATPNDKSSLFLTSGANDSGVAMNSSSDDGQVAIWGVSTNAYGDPNRSSGLLRLDGVTYMDVCDSVAHTNIMRGDKLRLTGVPTADPLVAGQVWNSSGTLKLSAG